MLTYGTRGDVEPYVAVARVLAQAGHEVVIAANNSHTGFIERAGLSCLPIRISSREILEGLLKPSLAAGDSRNLLRLLSAAEQEARHSLNNALQLVCAGADAIVSTSLLRYRAACMAELYRVPWMLLMTAPTQPTRAFPTPYLANGEPPLLARWAPRLSHRLILRLLWQRNKATLAEWRRQLELPPLNESLEALIERQRVPFVHMWSERVLPRPADWADHLEITGYCRLSNEVRRRLGEDVMPPGLGDWLDEGPPPVFFGFGAMPVTNPAALLEMVADTTRRRGLRALVGAGWIEFPTHALPEHVYVARAFNHDRVLPRCVAAVHHGGLGTTAASLSAGLPTLVCSVTADQPLWGSRVHALSAGDTFAFQALTAERLNRSLDKLLSPATRRRARALALRLAVENGVEATARAVLRCIGAGCRSSSSSQSARTARRMESQAHSA